MLKVRRALISVWDKKGIVEFARRLNSLKIEIISTGKTANLLKKSGVPAREISSITSFPEILSGRVKTLHPKIFGGILANKKHPLHMDEVRNLDIPPIDMVIVNLYPFVAKIKERLTADEMIEYIDIGGHSLIRAAAKNYKNVISIISPFQYKIVLEELEKSGGFISRETLRRFATEAFYLVKEYDNHIYNYFKGKEVLSLDLERLLPLRYGENPHQKAALYKLATSENLKFYQIQGKELSFNNLLDLDTAACCVRDFNEPAAAIVKHASICGVGIDKKLSGAYKKAYLVDPLSSFGGVIGLNKKVDRDTAKQILKTEFKECVVAPFYSKEALRLFSYKKNLRVLEADYLIAGLSREKFEKDIRTTFLGFLIQDKDTLGLDKGKLRVVTKRKPTARELKDLSFAWKMVKFVKSNAIVLAKNLCVLGIGGGEPSRVGALALACSKATKSTRGAVLASDGFFPKEDSVKLAARRGIKAIISPGGSIKDEDIIAACNKFNLAMVFTGTRHFRH